MKKGIPTWKVKSQISKPVIDTADIAKWAFIGIGGMNRTGEYAFYDIRNEPAGDGTLVIKSLKSNWEYRIIGGRDPKFLDERRTLDFYPT